MEVVEPTPDDGQQADTDDGSPAALADDTTELGSSTTANFYVTNTDYGNNGGFAMYPWIKDSNSLMSSELSDLIWQKRI